MKERPVLELGLDSAIFQKYCYLKDELVIFCRQMGLQTSGSKQDLILRIVHFLDTGEKLYTPISGKVIEQTGEITLETRIGENMVCSERLRAFFQYQIGKSFTFNIAFQRWLKSHVGRSYAEAIEAWWKIRKAKKAIPIGRQFEYNAYIRDFFKDNPNSSLQEAIRCWNYKKSLPGKRQYEPGDLQS